MVNNSLEKRLSRWWPLVLLIIAAMGVRGLWRSKFSSAARVSATIGPAAVPANVLAEIPLATFTDITTAAGLKFVHHNGAYRDKLLPETMGGGVACFDFDN